MRGQGHDPHCRAGFKKQQPAAAAEHAVADQYLLAHLTLGCKPFGGRTESVKNLGAGGAAALLVYKIPLGRAFNSANQFNSPIKTASFY